jgi:hypothetical protein
MAIEWQEPTAVRVSQVEIEEMLMSTSAVSSSALYQQLQSYFQTRNSDVRQLGQALQSGDLQTAQTEFNNITALGQDGPFASGNAFRVPQREQDFDAVGQALQSGDLAGAQTAFAQLQATFNHGTTNPGGSGSGITNTGGTTASGTTSAGGATTAAGTPEIVLNLSGAASGSTPEQITINLAQASSGAEQVSLSVGPEGSSNPTQFQFNLNPNSGEEIMLNLLNPSSTASGTTTSGTSASSGLSVSA